jgi:phage tail sheath protein FI
MPGPYLSPGVYVEEVPSGVRPITGVSTSATAFIDIFERGPADKAVRIGSWGDFERIFGGLYRPSEASYALQQFFANGGGVAWAVRVAPDGTPANTTLKQGADDALTIKAIGPGDWGHNLYVGVDHATAPAGLFNLVVREYADDAKTVVQSEVYRNVSTDPSATRFVDSVTAGSLLIKATSAAPAHLPDETSTVADKDVIASTDSTRLHRLDPGTAVTLPGSPNWAAHIVTAVKGDPNASTGIFALDLIAPDIFNLLCLPLTANLVDANAKDVIQTAVTYCEDKRAFMVVDPPSSLDNSTNPKGQLDTITAFLTTLSETRSYGAIYYPRLTMLDALNQNRPRTVGPSGTVAGIFARTDATRGVWKAPAGTDATLHGAGVALSPREDDDRVANPRGINALRSFPVFGDVVWGARTLAGADQLQSEWKYVPVRRTAQFLEESLFEGLRWVVFEPNDQPLWAQIRLNVGAFMHNLFRQGAFQGRTPREAYFVKCDGETTTQNDIDLGIVNILVGFAPLKPAEFVIIRIQQVTRPPET